MILTVCNKTCLNKFYADVFIRLRTAAEWTIYMYLKAIGTAKKVDDSENAYKALGMDEYEITVNGKASRFPEPLYLFWEQFLEGADIVAAKQSFLETPGFKESHFIEFLGALMSEGVIVQSE